MRSFVPAGQQHNQEVAALLEIDPVSRSLANPQLAYAFTGAFAAFMRHNVSKFSADYDLIESSRPADYSTLPMPVPHGQ
ncbi:hypothetical protein KIO73_23050 [Chelatococcus asaccharovorans]|nr:hypothetical protein [Chelatococcus asaccharovorans]